jgi:error-prone DNA polymerase
VRGLEAAPLPLFAAAESRGTPVGRREPAVGLPPMVLGEQVAEDYRTLGLSLRAHPLSILREVVTAAGYAPCSRLHQLKHGQRAAVAGLVTARQQPGSAKGVIFATIEDETAIGNVIVWPDTFDKFRHDVLGSRLMGVAGTVQSQHGVIHLLADRIADLSHLLDRLDRPEADTAHIPSGEAIRIPSRDFH